MRPGNRRAIAGRLGVFMLAAAQAAAAHTHLHAQTPAADAVVSAPVEIRLEFSADLEPALSTISLSAADAAPLKTAKSTVGNDQRKVMTLALPRLAPGQYTVHWVAVAEDGHRAQGTYRFTVK